MPSTRVFAEPLAWFMERIRPPLYAICTSYSVAHRLSALRHVSKIAVRAAAAPCIFDLNGFPVPFFSAVDVKAVTREQRLAL